MESGNLVLCAANAYEQKYYFNEQFSGIPESIQEELRILCVLFTQEVGGVFAIAFEEDGSVVLEKVRSGKSGTGFDAYNETYVDMVKEGIVDPTKVTRTALENAASIASVLLTTEALVADKPEPPAPAAAPNPDMGMY